MIQYFDARMDWLDAHAPVSLTRDTFCFFGCLTSFPTFCYPPDVRRLKKRYWFDLAFTSSTNFQKWN